MPSRIEKVRERMREQSLTALLVTHREDLMYLSGFRGSAGALVITDNHLWLVSDFRYVLQAQLEAPTWEFLLAEQPIPETLSQLFRRFGQCNIGFEPNALTVAFLQQLQDAVNSTRVTFRPAPGIVEQLRLIKDQEELACIREAVRITDAAYDHLLGLVTPGVTEYELALEAEWYMRTHGAEGLAFDIIVAAGERSALPHARPGARALQPGDLVLVDMGARYAGYCADMTRTFAVAEATSVAIEIYRICLQAQLAGVETITAGMSGREADSIVRRVIDEAGYSDFYGHGTGHGVGLEVHESPRLNRTTEDILPAGAMVTIEPGIYLPDVGGVRIEDLALLTNEGVEVFTAAPKPDYLPVFG